MTEQNRKTIILVLVVAIVLTSFGVAWYVPEGSRNSPKKEFVINEGDGSSKVARFLAQKGLVNNRYLFLLYLVLTGREKDLKAGRYLLSPGMSIVEVSHILSAGLAESDDIEVTIPEGFNVWEIDQLLVEKGLIKAGDFFKKFSFKEGFLFPDTYRLKKNQGQELMDDLVLKMKVNFDDKADEATLSQVVVASLLEKEVQNAEDMALVAGIIYKRLELGMLLQIDASVAYGACLQQIQNSKIKMQNDNAKLKNFEKDWENEALLAWGCDVTRVNLVKWIKIDGTYNTYGRTGLPTGPISNPGLRALEATRNSQKSEYLYYLSARDGKTIFSKTAQEHERNRAKYLRP